VLQPVIQFGTAIHGESFSGGALNRVQKLRRVGNNVSVLRKNWKSAIWILANKGLLARVAAVTQGQVVLCTKSSNGWWISLGLTVLIRTALGTCVPLDGPSDTPPALILAWESSRRNHFSPPAQLSAPGGVYTCKGISAR
jgi:hypothetical protein